MTYWKEKLIIIWMKREGIANWIRKLWASYMQNIINLLNFNNERQQLLQVKYKWKLKGDEKKNTGNWNNDCNWTRTHNHLVRKRTLNHLAKLARLRLQTKWLFTFTFTIVYVYELTRLQTKWLWVRVQLQWLKLQISRLFRARSSLRFRQL